MDEITTSRAPDGSLTALVERADRALYRAKQQGRNRTEVLTELEA
jgi:PleD family two-component response regulator